MDVAKTDAQHYKGRFALSKRQLSLLSYVLFVAGFLWLAPLYFAESTATVIHEDTSYALRPRLVKVPSGLLVSQTEITQENWSVVLGGTPANNAEAVPNKPIESISLFDALYYLNRVSELEGLKSCYDLSNCLGTVSDTPCEDRQDCVSDYRCENVQTIASCSGYRLPTEDEWNNIVYGSNRLGGTLEQRAWVISNGHQMTQPVAQKAPTGWSLHDVHGNVWELVWSEDLSTVTAMGCGIFSESCDYNSRLNVLPEVRRPDLGFRMVRNTAKQQDNMVLIAAGTFWMGCVPGDSTCS